MKMKPVLIITLYTAILNINLSQAAIFQPATDPVLVLETIDDTTDVNPKTIIHENDTSITVDETPIIPVDPTADPINVTLTNTTINPKNDTSITVDETPIIPVDPTADPINVTLTNTTINPKNDTSITVDKTPIIPVNPTADDINVTLTNRTINPKNDASVTLDKTPIILVDPTEDITEATPIKALINNHGQNYGSVDGKDHECYRPCQLGEKPKRCYYKFNIEWYQAMSMACSNCPFEIEDCYSKDCVTANGVNRTIIVINRKLPGPKIEVCQYDTIEVDLENNLLSSSTTMHWHGMHQVQTPYMDGAPYVTQCPILPESTFRYKFIASNSGTHFYHSHIGLQRGDGTFGPLIIRKPRVLEPNRNLYRFDLSEHIIMITDWTNTPALDYYSKHYHGAGPNTPSSLLINGVGKFSAGNPRFSGTATLRPAKFIVEQGGKYRFRVVNAEFLACPVEFSVEGHNITVIASDGHEIRPITVSSFVSFAGERFDFVLDANKKVDNYWIKVRSLLNCQTIVEARQVAILQYNGAPDAEPVTEPEWIRPPGSVLNAENTGEDNNKETIAISEMRSVYGNDDTLKSVPDYKIFIGFDLYVKNHSMFHRKPYMQNQVEAIYRNFFPQFNHLSMKLPKSPLLVSRPSSNQFCNESTVNDNCIEHFCQCSHVLSVKLNSVVELILVDIGSDFTVNHPFHLHGYSFRVLSQVKLSDSTTTEEVKKLDSTGLLKRNFINPPLKDTVSVPDGGYSVIRFKASNPGYWMFHCHIEFHADVGMSLVFKVGEHSEMKPVPVDFPTCGDYGV